MSSIWDLRWAFIPIDTLRNNPLWECNHSSMSRENPVSVQSEWKVTSWGFEVLKVTNQFFHHWAVFYLFLFYFIANDQIRYDKIICFIFEYSSVMRHFKQIKFVKLMAYFSKSSKRKNLWNCSLLKKKKNYRIIWAFFKQTKHFI